MQLRIGALAMVLAASLWGLLPQSSQPASDALLHALVSHEYDLDQDGYTFLVREAGSHGFFLLGELHGDNEIPALLHRLWPELWGLGYRHIAAEVSPWAARQLESVPPGQGPAISTLWRKSEAATVHAPAGPSDIVLWGCDMEEIQPHLVIRELAALNPGDARLQRMVSMIEQGYDRKSAPALLELLTASTATRDAQPNGISLRQNLLWTLSIERNRLSGETRMSAQNQRELLMKQQFLQHYEALSPGKVLLRFGRNHLHRGYDARGVSTLGNFVAEFAVAQGTTAFNVGTFGAGGQIRMAGELESADERQDEPAFAWFADHAKFRATLYDLRGLRSLLHAVPQGKRSALETNLVYWADAYDALICYKDVTPLAAHQ